MEYVQDVSPRAWGTAGAATLGLLSHQFFKRYEPKPYDFVGHVAVVQAALAMVFNFFGIEGLELLKICGVNLVVYLTSLSTSLILYRVAFHPLRHYPGPLLCKTTRFVATWHVMQRDTHLWLEDLHNKYGNAVRVSPNELAFSSGSSVEMIHGAKAGKLARGPFYQGDANRPADSVISTPDLYEHQWRRKIWERGFGTRQLKQYEPRVVDHLDTLVSQLRKRAGQIVDFTQWGEFFAYDVMSDLGFSEDFGMLEEGKPHRYVTALHGNARSLFIAGQTPWIRQIMWLFPLDAKAKQAGADFNKITRATYERRKARQDVKPDMFETISGKAATIGPRPLTEAEIVADASLIVMAGSTSTALCITFLFAYLCNNPSQLKRLQAEVDQCWDGESVLDVSKIGPAAAPYLQGCIEESLRIWPPAPAGMQRRSPMEDIIVDGKVVPSNTFISVTPFAAQRDSKNFSRPLDFMPERWIDAERPANFNHDVRAFIPFTVGQFTCLGKNLAYQEIRLFAAKVVKNFDFSFAPGFELETFLKGAKYKGTFLIAPLPVIFTERQS